MSIEVRDSGCSFCYTRGLGSLGMNDLSDLAYDKPKTIIEIARDAVKWTDVLKGPIAGADNLGKGLGACADVFNFRTLPRTISSFTNHVWGIFTDSENRMHHLMGAMEEGLDGTAAACDTLSGAAQIGGLTGIDTALLSKVSAACTMKSFTMKIGHSLREVYNFWHIDTSTLNGRDQSILIKEGFRIFLDLVWKVSILSITTFILFPALIEDLAISSSVIFLLTTSTALTTECGSWWFQREIRHLQTT